MRRRFRTVIFFTAFATAALTLVFALAVADDPFSAEHRMHFLAGGALGLAVALAAAFVLSTLLATPLEQRVATIVSSAREYAGGHLERPSTDYGDDEIGQVARAMDGAVRELGRRVDDLSRDRTRMTAILASMVEGVLVVDDQGRLQHVNDAARRMLSINHEALNQSYLVAIRHPDIVDQLSRALGGEQPPGLELSITREVSRTLVSRVAPVVAAGRGAVLVLHDITDLRRADQIRRDFVANVSHELRTPLTAIKGYSEALMDEVEPDDARMRFLEIVHRHATRMERLVNDLLRLARLDAGQEVPDFAPCDVATLVDSVTRDFEPAATAKRQQLKTSVSPPACALVVDPAKLHDILRNLVENAINYTPEGGLIEIEADVVGRKYQLRVKDTGPGIPQEDVTRVFERFYRVDKSRARPGGTGLWLSIVKNLTHVLGGEVTAGNRPGGGAIFTVTLPIRDAA
jgi:two-component system, OmpR family, phosphate regulon sensor histidine kinase PhoR